MYIHARIRKYVTGGADWAPPTLNRVKIHHLWSAYIKSFICQNMSPDGIIDWFIPDVMAKDEKSFVYSWGFREGLDQMPGNISIYCHWWADWLHYKLSLSPEIFYSIMNLHHDHHSLVCQRTEQILVVNFLKKIIINYWQSSADIMKWWRDMS